MKIIYCEQNTPEWDYARLGKITSSSFSKILTPTGKLPTKSSRNTYLYKKAAEQISGESEVGFYSVAMENGHLTEEKACNYFEMVTDLDLEKAGFIDSELGYGCSPDRVGLEVKCPIPSTQIEYLEANKLPTIYIPQVQGSMLVTGRDHWNFISFCEHLPPLILKVQRDDEYISLLEERLLESVETINQLVKKYSLNA